MNVRTQWEASSATVMMVIWKIKGTSVLVSNVCSLLLEIRSCAPSMG